MRGGSTVCDVALSVTTPDLVLAGEPLRITVDVAEQRQLGLRIALVPEQGLPTICEPRVRHGHVETTFTDLPPGAYEIRVTGVTPAVPVTPVTAATLVWADAN